MLRFLKPGLGAALFGVRLLIAFAAPPLLFAAFAHEAHPQAEQAATADESAFLAENEAAMNKMMSAMDVKPTGNPNGSARNIAGIVDDGLGLEPGATMAEAQSQIDAHNAAVRKVTHLRYEEWLKRLSGLIRRAKVEGQVDDDVDVDEHRVADGRRQWGVGRDLVG